MLSTENALVARGTACRAGPRRNGYLAAGAVVFGAAVFPTGDALFGGVLAGAALFGGALAGAALFGGAPAGAALFGPALFATGAGAALFGGTGALLFHPAFGAAVAGVTSVQPGLAPSPAVNDCSSSTTGGGSGAFSASGCVMMRTGPTAGQSVVATSSPLCASGSSSVRVTVAQPSYFPAGTFAVT